MQRQKEYVQVTELCLLAKALRAASIRATPPNRRAPLLLADIRTLMISIAETAGG